jgi:hypothetical protein
MGFVMEILEEINWVRFPKRTQFQGVKRGVEGGFYPVLGGFLG